MKIDDVFESVRDNYLTMYRKAINSYRKQFTPSAAEVLLETEGERPIAYRYYRMDLASGAVDPPDFTEVNPNTHVNFKEFRFEENGLSINLSPIVWNGVEFRISPPLTNDNAVQSWALRWIDPDERTKPNTDGLGAYIHSITMPESDSDSTILSVDFGSAPISSLHELLDILRESGATAIDIHSKTVLKE